METSTSRMTTLDTLKYSSPAFYKIHRSVLGEGETEFWRLHLATHGQKWKLRITSPQLILVHFCRRYVSAYWALFEVAKQAGFTLERQKLKHLSSYKTTNNTGV